MAINILSLKNSGWFHKNSKLETQFFCREPLVIFKKYHFWGRKPHFLNLNVKPKINIPTKEMSGMSDEPFPKTLST